MLNKTARVNNKTLRQLNKLVFPIYRQADLQTDNEIDEAEQRAGRYSSELWTIFIDDYKTALDENSQVYFECEGKLL